MSPRPHVGALTDPELAARIVQAGRGGTPDEEAELCRRFAPRIRQYGLRHLRDAASAADLVQRVLLLTLRKLREGTVREPERIASFVLGSARMLSREIERKAAREDPVPLEALAEVPAAALSMPEPLAAEHLSRCLDALAERDRAVVLLTFFHEQTSHQIATTLRLAEGNVRVIRHRAIERLRGCMGLDEEVAR